MNTLSGFPVPSPELGEDPESHGSGGEVGELSSDQKEGVG